MNPIIRWARFNLVGVMGMALQLTALALFAHFARGHYLYATAAALELTLLHNFIWHLHLTWRDRRRHSTVFAQLVRFHICNGLVSMVGNLVLMRLMIHQTHLPLLVANGIAIASCSLLNFFLGNKWAFSERA